MAKRLEFFSDKELSSFAKAEIALHEALNSGECDMDLVTRVLQGMVSGVFANVEESKAALDEIALLKVDDPNSLITLVFITIPPGEPHRSTANLMAPICINPANRTGKQVILHHSRYSHQEPLFL